jgi:hypothetical protein
MMLAGSEAGKLPTRPDFSFACICLSAAAAWFGSAAYLSKGAGSNVSTMSTTRGLPCRFAGEGVEPFSGRKVPPALVPVPPYGPCWGSDLCRHLTSRRASFGLPAQASFLPASSFLALGERCRGRHLYRSIARRLAGGRKVTRQLGNMRRSTANAVCAWKFSMPMSGELVKMVEGKIADKFKRQYAKLSADEAMIRGAGRFGIFA